MRRSLLVVGAVAGTLFASLPSFDRLTGASDDPKAPSAREQPGKKAEPLADDPPPSVDLHYLEASLEHESPLRKVNGVTFDITAKVERKFEGDTIVLPWTLSYDGSRPPLILVEPTIEKKTGMTTLVKVYAVPEGKKSGWVCVFASPLREFKPWNPFDFSTKIAFSLPKELFLQLRLGKSASGEFRVPSNDIRKRLADQGAGKFFDPKNPPRLFAEVIHEPVDRGEEHSLDAWTGKLRSDIVEVPQLKNW